MIRHMFVYMSLHVRVYVQVNCHIVLLACTWPWIWQSCTMPCYLLEQTHILSMAILWQFRCTWPFSGCSMHMAILWLFHAHGRVVAVPCSMHAFLTDRYMFCMLQGNARLQLSIASGHCESSRCIATFSLPIPKPCTIHVRALVAIAGAVLPTGLVAACAHSGIREAATDGRPWWSQ